MRNKQKKYIVSGGAGFIGSHIVDHLLAEGHKVVVVDNLYTGFESFIPKHENVEHVNVDISDWTALSKCFAHFQGVEGIFHLAACSKIGPSIKDPNITNDYNVTGTMNILQVMRMCNIKNIVYSGSSSYYGNNASVPCHEADVGNPETPYAITKRMGEEYCQTWSKTYGIRSVILRYFNVYGRRSPLVGSYAPVISLFFRQALMKETITIVGDGEQRRDFVHVGDVVKANLCAMDALAGPDSFDVDAQIFNIGTGTNNSVNEIAQMIKSLMASSNIVVEVAHVSERSKEVRETLANNSRARNTLGWEPTVDIKNGIDDLKGYYLNNQSLIHKKIFDF